MWAGEYAGGKKTGDPACRQFKEREGIPAERGCRIKRNDFEQEKSV